MNAARIHLHFCGRVRRNELRGEPEALPTFPVGPLPLGQQHGVLLLLWGWS